MANWLKMDKHKAALGLARQGWSFRRIGAELGIDRGTVARHVRAAAAQQAAANAAISITGSDPPDSQGAGPPGALPDGLPLPLTPAGTGPPDLTTLLVQTGLPPRSPASSAAQSIMPSVFLHTRPDISAPNALPPPILKTKN